MLYPVCMLAAVVVSGLLLRRWQAKLPLSAVEKWGLWLGAFCGGMLGAKLPFVLLDQEGFCSGRAWLADGKTILAGLVGAYAGVEIAKWTLEIRVKTGDTFAVPAAVAVGIGRLACFVGGCCYGLPTALPWGVVFATARDATPLPRHPAQLYEAGFHFLMAAVLARWQTQGQFRGQLIKLYLMAYLLFRFGSEFWRPEAILAGGLTAYQWAAVALLPVFAVLWWRDARTANT